MTPIQHTVASGIVSVVFWSITKSWIGSLFCFLSGIFIDLDHILDYWMAKKKITLRYSELMNFCAYEKAGKLYLWLHAYELMAILWGMIYYFQLNMAWIGIAVGMSVHLFLDTLVNPLRPFVYFLSYRIKNGFSKESTFPQDYYKNLR